MNSPQHLDQKALRRRMDAAAASFDDADFVHAAAREGLFARLAPMVLDASVVVDLGAATGAALRPLGKRFPKARVIAVDISGQMARKCRARRRFPRPVPAVQADARRLPFGDASVDVVFSNLMLPWIDDPAAIAAEVGRVLRKDGLFAFSTLGPDSLSVLRDAFAAAGSDAHDHVRGFADMHDIGDALVRAGLRDPVLDVDRLDVSYREPARLFADLTAVGARNVFKTRAAGLTGRGRYESLLSALADAAPIGVEFELVFGHAWGSGQGGDRNAIRIDPKNISIRQS
ncbi:MAG: methyltransferase domain-containing protein [Pseudomonadota bacterium]